MTLYMPTTIKMFDVAVAGNIAADFGCVNEYPTVASAIERFSLTLNESDSEQTSCHGRLQVLTSSVERAGS
jgi:hypothetical protein